MSRAHGPIGYFVHHQGRGHAERAAALCNELAKQRDIAIFSARSDIFPELADRIEVIEIPSLFEAPDGQDAEQIEADLPETLHCAPLGWATVSQAIALLTTWFAQSQPSLFITDVSAELGQLARIASVPHMAVLQHGDRNDPGHMASYRGAVGLLAPYAPELEQPDRPAWMRERTIYAPGVGVDCSNLTDIATARAKLGLDPQLDLVVVVGGGGGTGLPSAPLTLGARAEQDSQWVTLGKIQTEWHETPPPNLRHLGWVQNPADWISAANRLVSSCGNTTAHMIAAAAKPWIVVPEWRYFAEQLRKAEALDAAGAAAVSRQWPASTADWDKLWHAAKAIEPNRQRVLVKDDAATVAAREIGDVIERIWRAPQNAGASMLATGT